MNVVAKIIKALGGVVFSVLAPVLLVVAGGVVAGYGLYRDWSWVTNGGVVVAAVGVMLLLRMGGVDD